MQSLRQKPLVRPWALAGPIAVLLICLPLMRPLRHPDPRLISDDEQARLATIQSIVEHHTLDIRGSEFRTTEDHIETPDGHWYSDQSPVMSILLSGPYWVMHRYGLSFARNPVLAEYLLTLFGVTFPIAFATGLLYRMARLFELKRPYRAGLAVAVVVSSGWISYATVLSGGAAAAALVVMGTAALVQATVTPRRYAAMIWLTIAGLCAALAATYELTALAFLAFLLLVIAALRWPKHRRAAGALLYAAGAALPLLLYANFTKPITGDLRPGFLHSEFRPYSQQVSKRLNGAPGARWTDEEDEPPTLWRTAMRGTGEFLAAFFGGHGLLTHFPVLLLGLVGVSMVMHRHWPNTTKMLATATVLAGLGIVVGYTIMRVDWKDAMLANRWFLVFLPLTLFWAGAWLRREHRPATWVAAAVLLVFSTLIGLLGATDPQPRQGYDRYTAAGAWEHLVQPAPPPSQTDMVAVR